MMTFHRVVCTCFGIGYAGRGGGTLAALAALVGWFLLFRAGDGLTQQVLLTMGITLLGILSASQVERDWGKDSNRVVIDEVAGMCLSLWLVPVEGRYLICAFVLFRFFDIYKPFFIRRLEKLPGGWGVMADDLLAGIYANLVVQGVLILKLF